MGFKVGIVGLPNVGQGILAGIAILFCALILDKIVQGKKN
jgi:glycine betaine/proline transport system permease protein